MKNPVTIAENFKKLYSTNGEGDDYPPSLFSGLTLGVVVGTDDQLQGGRLQIYCPALNDNPKKPQHLPWANYISPFAGIVNNNQFYRGTDDSNGTSEGSLHYGFWAIPEMGAHVLVGCIDGDPRRRFWIGCMPEHQQTNTQFNGRYRWDNGRVNGPLTNTGQPMQPLHDNLLESFNDRNDSPEFRSRAADYQVAANDETTGQIPNSRLRDSLDQQNEQIIANDPDTWEHATLGAQGYDWSGFKQLGAQMSSRVYGLSSPGMHAFTMDDRPFNSRMRLRTTAGHQILMDDTNERIYITTAKSNTYIELDQSGNIDVYAKRRISFHAENDINFQSDKSFRVLAKEGIYMYSGVPEGGAQEILQETPEPGEIRIHSKKDMHLYAQGNMRQYSYQDTYHESNGDMFTLVDGNQSNQVGKDINIVTDTGSINTTVAADLNETVRQNSKRFTYGASSMASKLQNEIYSFDSTVSVSGNKEVSMKSTTGNVSLEAQGQADGTGKVRMKSPNSQVEVSDNGIEVMSDKGIDVKSQEAINSEVKPDGPSLSQPSVVDQFPEVPECNCGELPEVIFDAADEFMTATQAALVAYNAGFRGKDLVIAVALMGVTNFATGILNTVGELEYIWDSIVGPFQIKTLKDPDRYCGINSYRDNRNGQLQDPNRNAALAFRIFNETFPEGRWSASKWDEFAGDGKRILDNLDRAMDAVASLCNISKSDMIMPTPPAPSSAPTHTAISMNATSLDLQGTTDIMMKTVVDPLNQYTKSYTNMIDTIQETVVQTDQLTWVSGQYFSALAAGLDAVPSFSFALPFSFNFDIAGMLSVMQGAGLPDIFSMAPTQLMTPETLNLDFKNIPVMEIPAFDNVVGKVFNTASIPLEEIV